jgi:Transposase DDE domain group 1
VLRPGNAGANTAADHIEIVDLVLEQLPRDVVESAQIVVRTDSAAATHEFCDELRAARMNFLIGFDLTEPLRAAILALPESAWTPAICQDGDERDGAWVAEITEALNLSAWPEGTRVIVRRERPHPGAQLSFSDHDGHRFLATLTDLEGDPAELECLHRARAHAEHRIRAAKQTGLDNLPFRDFDRNAVWLELSLIARRPQHVDPARRARRRARPLRAQDAALPPAAHRRPPGLPRSPRHPAPVTQLAVGARTGRRLRPPRRAATTRPLTPRATDRRPSSPPATITAAHRRRPPPPTTPQTPAHQPTPAPSPPATSRPSRDSNPTHRISQLLNDPG